MSLNTFIIIATVAVIIVLFCRDYIRAHAEAPVTCVDATVIGKRTYRNQHGTKYYVCFENHNTRERIEFHVSGTQFGSVVEGEIGKLEYKAPTDFAKAFIAFHVDQNAKKD